MTDVKLIKQLREMTQAGFVDCKKALEESNNDLDAAVKSLREKGIAKANKKAGAIAAEGVTLVGVNDNRCIVCEINSQTDFTAQNANFISLSEDIKKAILNSNVETLEQANKLKLPLGETVLEICEIISGKIGEKIQLRRFAAFKKQNNEQTFGVYQHVNKKYSTIVLFDKHVDDTFKKNIAMHIVAVNPKFIDKSQVDQTWLKNEETIILDQTLASGKPKEFAQKIVLGRLNKLLAEVCLDAQQFDFEPGKTVGQVLTEKGIKILKFVRYEVGEGIEKKECNFADEVKAQMKQ